MNVYAEGKRVTVRSAERTFRNGERTFRSGELTFRSAEYKPNTRSLKIQ